MVLSSTPSDRSSLPSQLADLLDRLPEHEHGKWLERALGALARMADSNAERLDWKILTAAIEDLEHGFRVFYPYRHTRKVTIFGSARMSPEKEEYDLAVKFARAIAEQGYMVLTGAGGGIMQAGNEGAGRGNSFGLNIQLPFEQGANPFVEGDPKLIDFKYFFTRKLFFLRESDAIALFPGGYGTQDEAFECLTLCQTGKSSPVPLVLVDKPGGTYWRAWNDYICQHLIGNHLVSPDDSSIYTITDSIEVACQTINNFYRIYNSSRYVEDRLVVRLNADINEAQVEALNAEFSDILLSGRIEKSGALPQENGDGTSHLPRLVFYFNQRDLGRLYQFIRTLNQLEIPGLPDAHPERR